MRSKRESFPKITIGVDLGDRESVICEVDRRGEVVRRASIRTGRATVGEYFAGRGRCRVIIEAGTHSPWVARDVTALGHEVIVANPTRIYGTSRRKNDPKDAEFLARQGRADPALLHPITHRSPQAQKDLAVIRARDQRVRARTKLINHVRGAVKAQGGRVRRCSAEVFGARALSDLPEDTRPALLPLLEIIAGMTQTIRGYDEQIERLARDSYPEAQRLMQPKGVGALTAIAFLLLVGDPARFQRSREVGPYFGLVPKLNDSSESQPQLRISKAGDELGRRLVVSAAQYILGPFGPDCDLRRHGLKIAARGGKNAKKRAVVAVARKLAVLLHRLWVSAATYDPDWVLKQHAVGNP
jgi:transposase